MRNQLSRQASIATRRYVVILSGQRYVGLFLLLGMLGCKTAADFHNMDGVRLHQAGNQQAALQRFQQAVAASPTNPDAYYNLAASLHRVGVQTNNPDMLKQAEAVYNQCLDLNENHVDCRRGLAVLLIETDRSSSAFDLMKNWASQQPNLADAQIELARLYEEFGDQESAKLHLNQAVLVDPKASRAWGALGRIREQSGETEQALANYQRSLSLNPNQPMIGNRIASLQRAFTPDVNIAIPAPPTGTKTVTTPPSPNRGRY